MQMDLFFDDKWDKIKHTDIFLSKVPAYEQAQ